ncbi:MAG: GumC family protein [Methyloligellaceae bacterium]
MAIVTQYNPAGKAASVFGPMELYQLLLRRWKVISGVVLTGCTLVLFYVFMQTPLYTATTEIIIDPRSKNMSGEQEVLSGLGMDTAAIASQVRIIKSASVSRHVIETLKLYKDPEFNSNESKGFSPVSLLLGYILGGAQRDSSTDSKDPLPDDAVLHHISGVFSKKVKTRRIGKTYVIAISFTSTNPGKSAAIANQIAESYLVSQLQGKFEFNRRVKLWLRDRLEELQKKVQLSERAVELYRAQHNLISAKGKMPYEAEMDGLNEKLIIARVEMSDKYTQYQQVSEVLKAKGRLSSVGSVATSDEIKKLRVERARLAQEEAELITKFTPRHPKVIGKRNERRDLERQIEREAAKAVDNIKANYEAAKGKVIAIQKSLHNLQNRTQTERGAQIKLRELLREAEADRVVYKSFLERYKQKAQQEKSRTADTRVIEKAMPPSAPSAPNKRRALMISFVGFLALGVGLALALEMSDNSFKTPQEVEDTLNAANLVSIPKLSKADFYHDGQDIPMDRYVVMNPLTPFAEAMRTLKVSLELSNVDHPPKVVLFTSVLPNEGKTSICANFAQHAANVGVNTLLIDADLRNPSLSARLCPERNCGLMDLLSQRVVKDNAIITDHTGLDILPSKNIPYNTAEILGSESMKSLLQELRHEYDLIVLDTSPVMPVIDAKVLMEIVDSLVLVVEWDKTPKEAVRTILNTLDPERKKVAGIVLNKVEMKRMRGYGVMSYGGYYQDSGYYGVSK